MNVSENKVRERQNKEKNKDYYGRKNIMLGNFSYSNPTKLYFGEDSLCFLNEELPKYGKTVQLIYGNGSIKKNCIYSQVMR